MKKNSKSKKALALTTAGSLTLLGGFYLSAAHADSTPAPTPSVSTVNGGNPIDSQVNDESDSSTLVSDNQDVQDLIDVQLATDVNANIDLSLNEDSNVQEGDVQVDDLNAENQQEGDSFNLDINQANQDGNQEDAVALQADATIVTAVTAPEIQDMSNDDTTANNIIVGTPTK